MGCEKKVLPDEPETDQSRVLNPRGIECQADRDYPHSVTVYNRLESSSQHCRNNNSFLQNNYKMASDNNAFDEKNRDQDSVREPVESIDETISENVETENKSEDENEADIIPNPKNETEGMHNIERKETKKVPNCDSGDFRNVRSELNSALVSNDDNNACLVNATNQMDAEDNVKSKKESEHRPPASYPLEVKAHSSSEGNTSSNGPLSDINIQLEIHKKLEILKDQLDKLTDIPPLLFDVSLNCLKPSTIQDLSYHLDIESDILTEDDKFKDYRGMAEWIGLEIIFIKYISRSSLMLKTREVLSKWLTIEEEPLPTLKNLRDCLLAIDRLDVLEDMSIKMARDAVSWKITELEAKTKKKPTKEDTSWQLTRHDVVTGKQTYYTCCLVYADEDEGMAQIFTKLYQSVYPEALFFLPQFDLKQGKFLYETTAQVIEERCDGKVIFILSEYFFASSVCRFTVQFCKDMDPTTDQGNLIPFNLTNKYEHVPRVLRGISGIRWFRKSCRKRNWLMLTDSLLGGKMSQSDLEELKGRMDTLIEKDPEYYLSDPPYDDDTPLPGEPISVYDPPPEVENSDDPSSRHFNPDEDECLMSKSLSSLEQMGYVRRKSNLTRMRHYVRKRIFHRLFGSSRQRRRAPLPSTAHQPPIELPPKR